MTPIFKTVIRLALPMAGSRLIQMFSGFIGMIMLAHLGHNVLAASMLITSAQVTTIIVFISLLFSVSVVVGKSYGAGAFQEIGAIVQQGCLLGLILSVPLIIVFLIIDKLLLFFGQLPSLVVYVKVYFHALTWGTPSYMVLAVLQQACYGILKQRLVIISNLVCLFIFIVCAYAFIFGKWGIPAFGVSGLAYAFAVQAYLNVIILLSSFYRLPPFKCIALFARHSWQGLRYMKQIFYIGWPMSVQFGGELLGFFVAAIMIGWLGTNALAAVQVTQQSMYLFIVPMFAISEAVGILISQAVGSQRHEEIKSIGRAGLWSAVIISIIFSGFFILFPHVVASFYLNMNDPNNANVIHLIKILFIAVGLTLVFSTVRDVMTGALRGLYDTRFAMWVGIIVIWFISLPVGYLLAFPAHLGVIGFRFGTVIAFCIGAFLVLVRWRNKVKAFAN